MNLDQRVNRESICLSRCCDANYLIFRKRFICQASTGHNMLRKEPPFIFHVSDIGMDPRDSRPSIMTNHCR